MQSSTNTLQTFMPLIGVCIGVMLSLLTTLFTTRMSQERNASAVRIESRARVRLIANELVLSITDLSHALDAATQDALFSNFLARVYAPEVALAFKPRSLNVLYRSAMQLHVYLSFLRGATEANIKTPHPPDIAEMQRELAARAIIELSAFMRSLGDKSVHGALVDAIGADRTLFRRLADELKNPASRVKSGSK